MCNQGKAPKVKDLFFDFQGIEVESFAHQGNLNMSLFSQDDNAWEPLNKLFDLLKTVVDINPRIITIDKKISLLRKILSVDIHVYKMCINRR